MKSDACSGIIDRVTALEEKSEGYLSIYFGVIASARVEGSKTSYRQVVLTAEIPEYISTIKKVDFKSFTIAPVAASPQTINIQAFSCIVNSYEPFYNEQYGVMFEAYVTESSVNIVGSGNGSNYKYNFSNIQFEVYY